MDIDVEPVSLRFRAPVETAWGRLERRDLVRVRLREDGLEGVGDCGGLPGYLDLDATAQRAGALEIAGWDLRGRREERPVASLLADDPLSAVPVNATIGATDRAGASRAAADAVAAGFRCLKVKVGVGDDAGRLAAVRAAAGPDTAIRVDANGAWAVDEALAALGALEPVGIELCEEPVHGVEGLRAVRERAEVPIAMDETARDLEAIGSGATDAVCLKVAALGGIAGVMEAAQAARAAGSDVYLASTFDGPHGIAAAVHAAAALRVSRPCGLATLALFEGLQDPLPPREGVIAVPCAPGLGL